MSKRVYPALNKIKIKLNRNQITAVESFVYRHGMYSFKVKLIQKCGTVSCVSEIIKKQKDAPNRARREFDLFNKDVYN
jgi:hypothetical protein